MHETYRYEEKSLEIFKKLIIILAIFSFYKRIKINDEKLNEYLNTA